MSHNYSFKIFRRFWTVLLSASTSEHRSTAHQRAYSSRDLAPLAIPTERQWWRSGAWSCRLGIESKLPPQCLVLLCLLSILLRAVVQSWTAHFHSHHTHLLVVNKSPINHVCALRKTGTSQYAWASSDRYNGPSSTREYQGGEESASLRSLSISVKVELY